MRVFAYCDQRYEEAARRAAGRGAVVLTSPPVFAGDFNPSWLSGYDFIYLDLHGQAGSVYLYSGPEAQWAALALRTVRETFLGGAVVFATTCFLPETPFLQALLAAGAGAVIAGDGENFGFRVTLGGAPLLARAVMREMGRWGDVERGRRGEGEIERMVEAAKRRLRLSLTRLRYPGATADTLKFRVFRPRCETRGGQVI